MSSPLQAPHTWGVIAQAAAEILSDVCWQRGAGLIVDVHLQTHGVVGDSFTLVFVLQLGSWVSAQSFDSNCGCYIEDSAKSYDSDCGCSLSESG